MNPAGSLATGWAPAAGAVAAALLVIGANAWGRPALAVSLAILQAVLIAAWAVSFAATIDAVVLVVIAVGAADVVLLRTHTATAGSIAGVIGLSVIGVLFHQLARRDPRGVTSAVSLTLSAIVLGAALVLLLPLRELPEGRSAVFIAMASSAVALLVGRLLIGPDPLRRLAGLAAATALAVGCGLAKGGLSAGNAAVMGVCCGAAVLLADRLLLLISRAESAEGAGGAAGGGRYAAASNAAVAAILPLALACPVAYLVGRIIAP